MPNGSVEKKLNVFSFWSEWSNSMANPAAGERICRSLVNRYKSSGICIVKFSIPVEATFQVVETSESSLIVISNIEYPVSGSV